MASIAIDHYGKAHFGSGLETTAIDELEVVWQFGDYGREYAALRDGAALIDQSAGGPIRVTGASALAALQAALARDVEFLVSERARMSLVLDPAGAVVDVVTVVADDAGYVVLTGPGRARPVERALRDAAPGDALVENLEQATAVFSVEGPQAWQAVAAVLGPEYASLAYESSLPVEIDGSESLIARVGVTGEYGYTLVAPLAVAASVWERLAANGAVPIGHRVRETAMFELRQPIVHRELSSTDTVASAGLSWLVDQSKEDFVGRDAVLEAPDGLPASRPIGFRLEAGDADVGDALFVGPEEVGRIAYLVDSPGAGAPLGLAKVAPEWQASRLEFTTASGGSVRTLAPPYVVPKSWTTRIEV